MSEDGPALLVVDDIEDNRYTLIRRLNRQGYENVVEAENGRQALDLMRERAFDLVLLDIMMPEMDGYEMLEEVKSDPNLRDIPVIMISAIDEMDSVVKCIELGAEDYLPKPFNRTLLQARVGASLEKKKLRDVVKQAHNAGRRVRFWATPETPALWSELYDAGVDAINTDRLDELQDFLSARLQNK